MVGTGVLLDNERQQHASRAAEESLIDVPPFARRQHLARAADDPRDVAMPNAATLHLEVCVLADLNLLCRHSSLPLQFFYNPGFPVTTTARDLQTTLARAGRPQSRQDWA